MSLTSSEFAIRNRLMTIMSRHCASCQARDIWERSRDYSSTYKMNDADNTDHKTWKFRMQSLSEFQSEVKTQHSDAKDLTEHC